MTGALRFEARVRVKRHRRQPPQFAAAPSPFAAPMRSHCSSRPPRAIGASTTSAADPAARATSALDAAGRKSVDALRAAHVRDYQQLFNRVTLDLGPSAVDPDRRARARVRGRRRPGAGGALLPVRALPAHRQLAAGVAAGQPAGDLERQPDAALGQQVHDQHQHRDELLAGAVDQPGRDDGSAHGDGGRPGDHRRANGARDVRRRRLGGAPQHRPVARHRADRRPAVGNVADRGRVAFARAVGSLRVHRRSCLPARDLPDPQGRGAVLPRHARRRAVAPVARHLTIALAREPASIRRVARDGALDGFADPP